MKKTFIIGALAVTWFASTAASDVRAEEVNPVLTAQIVEEGSNIAWGQAVIELDRPIEEVFPIVVDYTNYVQFMPNFTKSRVIAQRGTRAQIYIEVSVAKGAITLWGQLNIAEHPESEDVRVVEAKLLEGNVDAFSAQWHLTPIDGGARTRVDFKIFVDPDIPLPSAIFSRENEKAAGRALQALRSRIAEVPHGST